MRCNNQIHDELKSMGESTCPFCDLLLVEVDKVVESCCCEQDMKNVNGMNVCINRPRSIYQYSNMAPRLSGQNSIFGVVFFVSKSLLGIEGQKKLEKFAILTRKPRSHARILIYRTWPIVVQFMVMIMYQNASTSMKICIRYGGNRFIIGSTILRMC